jgi:hypothetical protein
MKKAKQALLLITIISLSSCTNVLDKKVNVQTGKEDIAKIKEKYSDKYSAEELNHLSDAAASYVIASALAQGKAPEKTYGELLNGIHEEKVKYDSAMKDYNTAIQKLKSSLEVTVVNFGTSKNDFEDFFMMTLASKNDAAKNISAFEGTMVVQSITGTELGRFKYESSKTVAVGQQIQEQPQWSIFEHVDQLEHAEDSKIKFIWHPHVIVFEDGEKLNTPAKPQDPFADPFKD